MVDINECAYNVWQNVSSKVNKAVVFIDDACAESLHWNGGALVLFNAGALAVKEFSSFENGKEEQRKAVFVISSALHGTNMEILHDILRASSFQYVIVVTSLSPAMHTIVKYGRGEDETKAFINVEEQLLEWMRNMNYTVEIVYQPIVAAPITPNLFVLPEHSHLFPLLPSDLDSLLPRIALEHKGGGGTISDLDFGHLPKELQFTLKLLVCSLNSFLESLGVSEDVYGLGHTSRIVATELASLPWAKQRRKNARHKASVLLVDRSLDVTNVVGHHWDTLLDRVLSLLPRLPKHCNDVSVNMAPICSITSNPDNSVVVPGCLAHPQDDSASALLQFVTGNKYKESLMEVNRQLVEAASRDSLPIKLTGRPGRVTADQLDSHLTHFKGKMKVIKKNKGLLQIVLAVIEALRCPNASKLDNLLGIEKGLVQNVGDVDAPCPLNQVIQILQKQKSLPSNDRTYSLEEIFMLMIFIYSLLEEQNDVDFLTEERNLQDIIVGTILEEKDVLPDFLKALVGEEPQKETVALVIQDTFEKLRCLSRTREGLTQFDTVYEPGTISSPASLLPLCKTVMDAIFDRAKPELADILYKSTGFRDLLKSSFGLFMNVSKPRPSDHPLLIVFIIGGTTFTEVRQIREAVTAQSSNTQVIVGSTRLLSPRNLLDQIFVTDHLHPKTD